MQLIKKDKKIKISKLSQMAKKMFGHLVKAVVDVEKEQVVINAGLHADEEKMLIESGSKQKNLWGINLYPDFFDKEDFIEFDSMINLRPMQNNRTRNIEDVKIRQKIIKIINKAVIK